MTDIDKVRLLIGDTTLPYHFNDVPQIQAFLDMAGGSILLAASYALESWAASVTSDYNSERIGDYAYTKKDAENKMALAKKYREEDASSPYLTWAEMDLTTVPDGIEMGE